MLASFKDVLRYLADKSATEYDVEPFLEAADEWVRRITGGNWDAPADTRVTDSFWHVRPGDFLNLKTEDPTDVEVRLFIMPTDEGTPIDGSLYSVMSRGRIRLVPIATLLQFMSNVRPEVRDTLEIITPGLFARVEVSYLPTGKVPFSIREAVAMIAAFSFQNVDVDMSAMRSESMGDYSYTLETGADGERIVIPKRASRYLRPFRRTKRVFST
jgi:hypothetical protein